MLETDEDSDTHTSSDPFSIGSEDEEGEDETEDMGILVEPYNEEAYRAAMEQVRRFRKASDLWDDASVSFERSKRIGPSKEEGARERERRRKGCDLSRAERGRGTGDREEERGTQEEREGRRKDARVYDHRRHEKRTPPPQEEGNAEEGDRKGDRWEGSSEDGNKGKEEAEYVLESLEDLMNITDTALYYSKVHRIHELATIHEMYTRYIKISLALKRIREEEDREEEGVAMSESTYLMLKRFMDHLDP